MRDGSPGYLPDGCSNLAKFSQGRNKNFPKTFLWIDYQRNFGYKTYYCEENWT